MVVFFYRSIQDFLGKCIRGGAQIWYLQHEERVRRKKSEYGELFVGLDTIIHVCHSRKKYDSSQTSTGCFNLGLLAGEEGPAEGDAELQVIHQ